MSSRAPQPDTRAHTRLETAIAALIANTGDAHTRKVRRKDTITEIADYIGTAAAGLGGVRAVADRIGISEQQLRDFLAVRDLSPVVQRLVRKRSIDSVDVVRELAKLRPRDQLVLARRVAAGTVTSKDVRAMVSLRRRAPHVAIRDAIERVRGSQDIKHYVAEFPLPHTDVARERLRKRFGRVVGSRNVLALSLKGRLGRLSLSREGMQQLQAAAKEKGLTKRQLIEHIVREESPRDGS